MPIIKLDAPEEEPDDPDEVEVPTGPDSVVDWVAIDVAEAYLCMIIRFSSALHLRGRAFRILTQNWQRLYR